MTDSPKEEVEMENVADRKESESREQSPVVKVTIIFIQCFNLPQFITLDCSDLQLGLWV